LTSTQAQADQYRFEIDGQVQAIYGSGASLTATGLAVGSPVHFTVHIDRAAGGYYLSGDGSQWFREDTWTSPLEHRDYFFAELESASYTSPDTYLGYGREFFYGVDVVSETFSNCAVLGRLYVGPELFHIDNCAPVADWSAGMSAGAAHIWHDDATGDAITVQMSLTVTSASQLTAVPALRPATLACLGVVLSMVSFVALRQRD
jgi:hypothetical protein